ncbi:transcriptional regulator, TetR family [Desulfatibacillum aliphaticivorans]|uniref:Transcriptional regulator, TetR family n=2 Tax=Desulfatibacillum aliphaticivorans TaxID=218208 RepID=B8F9B5_DESAL|nr:transcriptional regulator, TetR family [Desulfatibacillum aliphaticivorans]
METPKQRIIMECLKDDRSMKIVEKTRRKYMEYQEREKEILACAIRLFNERGYKDATTAAIAKESGISEPILYKHFENKKDLFLSCFQNIVDELIAYYKVVYKSHPEDELGYMEGVIRAYVNFVMENPDKSMFLVHLMSYQNNPDFAPAFNQFMEASITTIEKALKSAKANGLINPTVDLHFLAAMFVSQYFTVMAIQNFVDPVHYTNGALIQIMKSLMNA